MQVTYDKDVEAIYIRLRDLPYAYGEDLDDSRRVDFSADGTPIGVELLSVDLGVNLDDLPERRSIEKALIDYDVKIYAYTSVGISRSVSEFGTTTGATGGAPNQAPEMEER